MDRFIAKLPREIDADLALCREHGLAYQLDMTPTAQYDGDYFGKCLGYEGQPIANAINAGRADLVARHFGAGRLCDVGVGSGEFIKTRPNTFGVDVNPVAIDWLQSNGLWAQPLDAFGAYSFWDVLEHVPIPEVYLGQVQLRGFVFTSIPVFDALDAIRESRHYRPGEHLYYWSAPGFVDWMNLHGFALLEHATFEMDAGRDSIHSFAFKRTRWPS